MPPPPGWLCEHGIIEWYTLGHQLDAMGLFNGAIDYTYFAMYCNQYDTYVTLLMAVKAEGKLIECEAGQELNPKLKAMFSIQTNLLAMQRGMGLSPLAREAIKHKKKESPKLAIFLGAEVNPEIKRETRGRKPYKGKPSGY